jgi:formylglycine-generating enzyme required for sulfatase activity
MNTLTPKLGSFVTAADYKNYLAATGQQIPKWVKGCPEDERLTGITAEEADAYAEWGGYRLLTDDELSDYMGDWTWVAAQDVSQRVARGGSWGFDGLARVSVRVGIEASDRDGVIGVRCAGNLK